MRRLTDDFFAQDGGYCQFGKCIIPTTFYHPAYSLGITQNYEEGGWKIINDNLTIWTEPVCVGKTLLLPV